MAERTRIEPIDPASLPKHFDARAAEERLHSHWQEAKIYHYDPERPREETFVVDTPPPTVSGSLHVGHVFSYTHPDIMVRYKRMRGFNVFYPMGWDDNGLPTERRVQNFYHVRCDPTVHYEADLRLSEASAKQRKGPPRLVSRKNFIELCLELTEVDEQAFLRLFERLGLSVDWRQTYATIDDHCRKIAQLSFLDLHEKGLVYQNWAPTMWDVDFQTAVAQAEVEDREMPGAYHDLEFGVEGSERSFVISTTRPELLPACVGVTAHPSDERYQPLFGKRAITPLFRVPVPIFPSELADPGKGSGILMVCTFGDQTDVHWWREQNLELRQLLERNGRLREVTFGKDNFESLEPDSANRYYEQLAGKNLKQARAAIVEQLRDVAGSATGNGAPLKAEPRAIRHAVKFFEKGERPLEFLSTRQWFVKLLEHKQDLLDKGAAIRWRPEFMHTRYRDWTDNLGLDWCLSRQRYFGVPIPAWYPIDEAGETRWNAPIVPSPEQLPIDPMADAPPGFDESQRNQPGGFTGEPDIFDTWFTSSLTPQIGSHWGVDERRHARLFPADVRPQSHEIIRTWAFYTIAKALLHENQVPWYNVMISGWILDPDRKKMSKSRGNVVTPIDLLDEYGVDAVRYWAASARLGADTAFDKKVFKIGKRLTTKLFNAGKFVLSQGGDVGEVTSELDRAFVAKLRSLVQSVTQNMEEYKSAQALQETESFFWADFTDTYLELAKPRVWNSSDAVDEPAKSSALTTLRLGLDVLLRLFAPVLPYISEEIYAWSFAAERGKHSIHVAPWPSQEDFEGIAEPDDAESFDTAVACLNALNRAKSDAGVSAGRVVLTLTIEGNEATLRKLEPVLRDVLAAGRCQEHSLDIDPSLPDGELRVSDAEFAAKA